MTAATGRSSLQKHLLAFCSSCKGSELLQQKDLPRRQSPLPAVHARAVSVRIAAVSDNGSEKGKDE